MDRFDDSSYVSEDLYIDEFDDESFHSFSGSLSPVKTGGSVGCVVNASDSDVSLGNEDEPSDDVQQQQLACDDEVFTLTPSDLSPGASRNIWGPLTVSSKHTDSAWPQSSTVDVPKKHPTATPSAMEAGHHPDHLRLAAPHTFESNAGQSLTRLASGGDLPVSKTSPARPRDSESSSIASMAGAELSSGANWNEHCIRQSLLQAMAESYAGRPCYPVKESEAAASQLHEDLNDAELRPEAILDSGHLSSLDSGQFWLDMQTTAISQQSSGFNQTCNLQGFSDLPETFAESPQQSVGLPHKDVDLPPQPSVRTSPQQSVYQHCRLEDLSQNFSHTQQDKRHSQKQIIDLLQQPMTSSSSSQRSREIHVGSETLAGTESGIPSVRTKTSVAVTSSACEYVGSEIQAFTASGIPSVGTKTPAVLTSSTCEDFVSEIQAGTASGIPSVGTKTPAVLTSTTCEDFGSEIQAGTASGIPSVRTKTSVAVTSSTCEDVGSEIQACTESGVLNVGTKALAAVTASACEDVSSETQASTDSGVLNVGTKTSAAVTASAFEEISSETQASTDSSVLSTRTKTPTAVTASAKIQAFSASTSTAVGFKNERSAAVTASSIQKELPVSSVAAPVTSPAWPDMPAVVTSSMPGARQKRACTPLRIQNVVQASSTAAGRDRDDHYNKDAASADVSSVKPEAPAAVVNKNGLSAQSNPGIQSKSVGSPVIKSSPGYQIAQRSANDAASPERAQGSDSLSREDSIIPVPLTPIQYQSWAEIKEGQDLFQRTSAWDEALDILESRSMVLLSGPLGSGKRTLGRALLRGASYEGVTVLDITSYQEWRKHVGELQPGEYRGGPGNGRPSQVLLVLLDHVFGRGVLKTTELVSWRRVFDVMPTLCGTGKLKVVFTFYPHILQALRKTLPDCDLLSSIGEVVMERLSKEEKVRLLRAHLKPGLNGLSLKSSQGVEDEREEQSRDVRSRETSLMDQLVQFVLRIDESGALFPGCCRRLASTIKSYIPPSDPETNMSNFQDHLESSAKIFSRPSPVYEQYVSELLHSEVSLQEMLCAAFSLLLASEDLTLTDTQNVEAITKRCHSLGFSPTCSPFNLLETLKKFIGILVLQDCRQFVSRHAYEGTALAVGKCNPSLVLQLADWTFIVKRCVVPWKDTTLQSTHTPFLLKVKRLTADRKEVSPEYKALVNRISSGMKDPETLMLALQHPALEGDKFVKDLENKLGDDLSSILTETRDSLHKASLLYWSLFSCSFFSKWVFKTASCCKGRFRKEDLIVAVSACCVMADKSDLLAMFLKYWHHAASGSVKDLLNGSHVNRSHFRSCSNPLLMPLPKVGACVCQYWMTQLKYLRHLAKSVPKTLMLVTETVPQLCTGAEARVSAGGARLSSAEAPFPELLHPVNSSSGFHSSVSPWTPPSHPQSLRPRERSGRMDTTARFKTQCLNISQPLAHLAALYNNVPVIDLLAESYPRSLLVTNSEGKMALHVAAYHGRIDVVDQLVRIRGLVSKVDSQGNNALHEACSGGQVEVVRRLIEVDPTLTRVQNQAGRVPADLASEAEAGYQDILQLLWSVEFA